jgi:hypothetical protein
MRTIKTLSFAVVFLLAGTCFGSEISRITLSELESKSAYIVLAKVTKLVKQGDADHVTIKVDSRCLEMYEKMFDVIAKLEPTSGKSPQIAQYQVGKLKLSYGTFDDMRIMFMSDGKHWVFHDPSFEKKLKRKLTPQLEKTSIKDLPSKKRTGR